MLVQQLRCLVNIEEMSKPSDLVMCIHDNFLCKVEVVVQLSTLKIRLCLFTKQSTKILLVRFHQLMANFLACCGENDSSLLWHPQKSNKSKCYNQVILKFGSA